MLGALSILGGLVLSLGLLEILAKGRDKDR